MFEAKLIALYSYVEERYESELKYHCWRFSNNGKQPPFSDVEAITLYLYACREEGLRRIKDIHRFARRHLSSWFPQLPSYQAFNHRLNRMSNVFEHLCADILEQYCPEDVDRSCTLTDSVPVITCSAKRRPKVAPEVTAKGFNSTKGIYYYGLKLHLSGWRRKGTLPFPCALVVTPASEHDLTVFKDNETLHAQTVCYGDKAYFDVAYFDGLYRRRGVDMLTPVKYVTGHKQQLKQFDRAADELYSRAVSAVRQPLESLYNWLIEHSDIQRASKVRSTKGLIVHVFAKIAAAFSYLILNP